MAYSEAQKRATIKYKDEYRAQAAKRGMSLNAYIISLIEKDMKEGTSLE